MAIDALWAGICGILGVVIGVLLTYYFNKKNMELQLRINKQSDFVEKYTELMNNIDKQLGDYYASTYSLAMMWDVKKLSEKIDKKINMKKDLTEATAKFVKSLTQIKDYRQKINQFMYLSLYYFEDNAIFVKLAETDNILQDLLNKDTTNIFILSVLKIFEEHGVSIDTLKSIGIDDKSLNEIKKIFKTDNINEYLEYIKNIKDSYEHSNYELIHMLARKKNPIKKK